MTTKPKAPRQTKAAKNVQARMAKQRKDTRAKQRREARAKPVEVEGAEQEKVIGRDADGKKINMKVTLMGWKAILGHRVDLIEEIDPDSKRGDPIPTRVIYRDTDIYHAVRSLKHVRGSHRTELQRTERLFEAIDKLQSILNTEGHRLKKSELVWIRQRICTFIDDTSKTRSGRKLVAKFELEKVPGLLDQAMEETNAFRNRNRISVACTMLVVFKDEYGTKREKEILEEDRYNKAREIGLRQIRDIRLWKLLEELSGKLDDPKQAIGVIHTLYSDHEVVIKGMRKAKQHISKGNFDEALSIVENCGKSLKVEWLKRELRDVYEYISSSMKTSPKGWRAKARKMLENFARFIGQRNTGYIQIQLGKTRDSYMKPVVEEIKAGNQKISQAVKTKDIPYWRQKKLAKEAASCFRRATIGLVIPKTIETRLHV